VRASWKRSSRSEGGCQGRDRQGAPRDQQAERSERSEATRRSLTDARAEAIRETLPIARRRRATALFGASPL